MDGLLLHVFIDSPHLQS